MVFESKTSKEQWHDFSQRGKLENGETKDFSGGVLHKYFKRQIINFDAI